ncbi:MAG: glycoside hydrolase family 99-like domain-containing protein [Betaproteobacteria bacterium]|nr:glycoside hydrolase family 99-like domain-containing protein [Betaproteobacteria bacterium]
MNSIRPIAFYLPQFHPIPENDEWWGKGFTEWTNTAKAKPMFPGHYQPHVPADLGFYDLRLSESRVAQAELAKQYGIEGFCYYHYWFGGRRILEKPFEEVLKSGSPDFGFCLCWANETWSGIWHGNPKKTLIEQTYPGIEDHQKHFDCLLPAFRDPRYIKVDGKPIFVIYRPFNLPDPKKITGFWRKMAKDAGLKGLHLIGVGKARSEWTPADLGFDASVNPQLPVLRPNWISWRTPLQKIKNQYEIKKGLPTIHSYESSIPDFIHHPKNGIEDYPCVIPNWDNTPRSSERGLVLHGSTPELFRLHLREAVSMVRKLPEGRRFLFIKSWNEWAEGNHLEPDVKFGHGYLKVFSEELAKI